VQTLLANTGTTKFGPTSTYTQGGVTHTIAQGDPTQLDLSPGVVNEATPSALASDRQSFNDCAYAQSCAAPKSAGSRVPRSFRPRVRTTPRGP
jgi:hypothetical protein